jgi:hypothetical protein
MIIRGLGSRRHVRIACWRSLSTDHQDGLRQSPGIGAAAKARAVTSTMQIIRYELE